MTEKKTKKTDVDELLEKRDQKAINVKCPASFDVSELEINGDLVILRGWTNAFSKVREVTRVYKRVR